MEKLIEVELEHGKNVTIGRGLVLIAVLIIYLSCNIDFFARKVEDMHGINPKVVVHKLNISL